MLIITGNHSKSKITLDVEFDEFRIENTLTKDKKEFTSLNSIYKGGIYYDSLIDFSDLELGEYKYTALLSGSVKQTGLLVIKPFDEDEEVVQYVTPKLEQTVITYQN